MNTDLSLMEKKRLYLLYNGFISWNTIKNINFSE